MRFTKDNTGCMMNFGALSNGLILAKVFEGLQCKGSGDTIKCCYGDEECGCRGDIWRVAVVQFCQVLLPW